MPPNTAEAVAAVLFAAIATFVYAVFHASGVSWAGSAPGLALGIAGTLLMLWSGISYTRRKRAAKLGASGLGEDMRMHAALGLAGPYMVVLHSGWQLHGVAGVLLVVTVVVAVAGVVGRLVITRIARPVAAPNAAELAQLDEQIAALERQLAGLARAGTDDEPAREARRTLRAQLAAVEHQHDRLRMRWRAEPGGAPRRVLSAWWLLHVPLSYVLAVLLVTHVLGALYYGVFSR